ncbi:nitroreductase family deazaflavin-dependent oxidoreductase, partial [bacterium]|nr:nitroreductase family deazaflavin-dependent oxidoreductase [bacterium]
MINRFGGMRVGIWLIKHAFSPLQRWIIRVSRGRFLSNVGAGREVLLLTTKGRRTGKDRTVPIFYLRDGDELVICNVTPPYERTNPWTLNLRSNPIAQIQIGPNRTSYRAREATAAELDRLWPKLVALWPSYQEYFDRGGRRSIFLLQRASPNQTAKESARQSALK